MLLLPLVAAAYAGGAWLALLPAAAAPAALALAVRRDGARAYRPLGWTMAPLGLLLLGALVSAAVHPGPAVPWFLRTLVACAAVTVLLGVERRPAHRRALVLASATTLGMLAWVLAVSPGLVAARSPAAAALVGMLPARQPPAPGGGMPHPNEVGLMGAVTAAGWLAETVAAGARRGRLGALPHAGLGLAAVVLSGSRGAWAALACGGLTVIVLRARRLALPALAAAGAAVAVAAAAPSPPAPAPAVARLARAELGDLPSRVETWRVSWLAIRRSPWLGTGIGSFPAVYARPAGSLPPVGAHDTFLQVWLDLGALGLAATAALTAQCLARAVRAPAAPGALTLAAMTAAWLAHSAVESTIVATWFRPGPGGAVAAWHEVTVPIAFALWGLGVNLERRSTTAPGRRGAA